MLVYIGKKIIEEKNIYFVEHWIFNLTPSSFPMSLCVYIFTESFNESEQI